MPILKFCKTSVPVSYHGISNVMTAASTGAKAEDEEKESGNEDSKQEAEKKKGNPDKGKVMSLVNHSCRKTIEQ